MIAELSPLWLVVVLAAAALVIAGAGTRLARVADQLADLTGLGEALFGALFLGAVTSIPGVVATVVAALKGHTDLAIGNALGGIAAQTFFLAVADLFYRRANLEHAAASLANLIQAALLVALLCIPLAAGEVTVWEELPVHPVSPVLVVAYVLGIRLASRARKAPLWTPTATAETRTDVPDSATLRQGRIGRRWGTFAVLAGLVAGAGWTVAEAGLALSAKTGISETLVGVLLTAVITSLPELITTVAAVRQGALTLAVSDIIGGNSFDVLFLVAADLAFTEGSIYHYVTGQHRLLIAISILMTAILILGMLRRERHGLANIGFESALLVVVYVSAMGWIAAGG